MAQGPGEPRAPTRPGRALPRAAPPCLPGSPASRRTHCGSHRQNRLLWEARPRGDGVLGPGPDGQVGQDSSTQAAPRAGPGPVQLRPRAPPSTAGSRRAGGRGGAGSRVHCAWCMVHGARTPCSHPSLRPGLGPRWPDRAPHPSLPGEAVVQEAAAGGCTPTRAPCWHPPGPGTHTTRDQALCAQGHSRQLLGHPRCVCGGTVHTRTHVQTHVPGLGLT